MAAGHRLGLTKIQAMFMEIFGLSRAVSLSAILLISLVTIFAVFWFFHSAPPDTITITTGPEGSIFQTNAEKYAKILARNGVKLKILPSQGSLENLKRLLDPSFRVDIGFVQGGVADGLNIDKLVSLGSISYEPLLVFYRSDKPVDLLSQLSGKRLAIGPVGSGTRSLALTLLAANGIEPGGATALVDLDAEDAAKALVEGNVDGVFLMGDVASSQLMRKLLRTPGIHHFQFHPGRRLCASHPLFEQADPSEGIHRFRKEHSRARCLSDRPHGRAHRAARSASGALRFVA